MSAVVLMYHRLGRGVLPGREPGEEIYAVPGEEFERHLEAIAGTGVPLLRPEEELRHGRPLPPRALALTFDDGNATDVTAALPALERRGLAAAFFVSPGRVGQPSYLDWDGVRALHRAGMTVGAHGHDHTLLSTLPDDGVRRQLRDARRELDSRLGVAPWCLSLPGGAGGRRVVDIAHEEGYAVVFGSVPRRVSTPPARGEVPRIAVRGTDAAASVRALAEQRAWALLRHDLRYRAVTALRRGLGERLYARVRRGFAEEVHAGR